MSTETKMTDARELLNRARPFLLDEATKYEDDGSNEPLELARDIEIFLATPPGLMAEGDKTAAQSRMIDELTAPVVDGPDWRYAAVSAIEYIDAGDHDEARDMLQSALALSGESSAPSAPVGEARQAKEWLLELMGDHDFDMPTEAFDELVEALAGQHREPEQPAAVDEAIRAAVLAEREACAKACDDRAAYYHAGDDDGPNTRRGMACAACASVIRWRSTVPASFLAKHEASIEERLAAQQQEGA